MVRYSLKERKKEAERQKNRGTEDEQNNWNPCWQSLKRSLNGHEGHYWGISNRVTRGAVEMWNPHWNKADGKTLKTFWQSNAKACTDFSSAFLWIWIRSFELTVHSPTTIIIFFKKSPIRESVFPCQMQWSLPCTEVQI